MATSHETGTNTQQLQLEKARSSLRSRIASWRRLQAIYVSQVMGFIEHRIQQQQTTFAAQDKIVEPEDELLLLPSSFPENIRQQRGLVLIAKQEFNLRLGSATDALRDVRNELRLSSAIIHFKREQLRGQTASTRAYARIAAVETRMQEAASRYRIARTALLALGLDPNLVRELKSDDIRRMASWVFEDGLRLGEGNRQLSWIWLVDGISDDVKSDAATSDGKPSFIPLCHDR